MRDEGSIDEKGAILGHTSVTFSDCVAHELLSYYITAVMIKAKGGTKDKRKRKKVGEKSLRTKRTCITSLKKKWRRKKGKEKGRRCIEVSNYLALFV